MAGGALILLAGVLSEGVIVAMAQERLTNPEEMVRSLTAPSRAVPVPAQAEGRPESSLNAAGRKVESGGTGDVSQEPGTTTRGIRVENRVPVVTQSPSLNLDVAFEYGSARLTADARIVLDNLGAALNDPVLRNYRIRIAGHTDAKGSDSVNLNLSRQRAQAVADYLVREHQILAKRLLVEGYGRTQLLDPANPDSAVNRRVQIINAGN